MSWGAGKGGKGKGGQGKGGKGKSVYPWAGLLTPSQARQNGLDISAYRSPSFTSPAMGLSFGRAPALAPDPTLTIDMVRRGDHRHIGGPFVPNLWMGEAKVDIQVSSASCPSQGDFVTYCPTDDATVSYMVVARVLSLHPSPTGTGLPATGIGLFSQSEIDEFFTPVMVSTLGGVATSNAYERACAYTKLIGMELDPLEPMLLVRLEPWAVLGSSSDRLISLRDADAREAAALPPQRIKLSFVAVSNKETLWGRHFKDNQFDVLHYSASIDSSFEFNFKRCVQRATTALAGESMWIRDLMQSAVKQKPQGSWCDITVSSRGVRTAHYLWQFELSLDLRTDFETAVQASMSSDWRTASLRWLPLLSQASKLLHEAEQRAHADSLMLEYRAHRRVLRRFAEMVEHTPPPQVAPSPLSSVVALAAPVNGEFPLGLLSMLSAPSPSSNVPPPPALAAPVTGDFPFGLLSMLSASSPTSEDPQPAAPLTLGGGDFPLGLLSMLSASSPTSEDPQPAAPLTLGGGDFPLGLLSMLSKSLPIGEEPQQSALQQSALPPYPAPTPQATVEPPTTEPPSRFSVLVVEDAADMSILEEPEEVQPTEPLPPPSTALQPPTTALQPPTGLSTSPLMRKIMIRWCRQSRPPTPILPLTRQGNEWMVLVLPNGSPAFTRRSYADSYSTIIDDARGVFRSGQLVDKLLRPAPTREAYTVAARGRALLGHHRRASAVAFYIPFERLQAIRLAGREDDQWVPLEQCMASFQDEDHAGYAARDALIRLTQALHEVPSGKWPCVPSRRVCPRPLHLRQPPSEIANWHEQMLKPCAQVHASSAFHVTAAAIAAASATLSAPDVSVTTQAVLRAAQARARASGSNRVSARDIRDAASELAGTRRTPTVMDPVPPSHQRSIDDKFVSMASEIDKLLSTGDLARRPRVLLFGEESGVNALALAECGWDVAVCDLVKASVEHPRVTIIVGDGRPYLDSGWDLVLGFPPCTYLSNAGVQYLHTEPERWNHLRESVQLFSRVYEARAPFVAVENSKMHGYARALLKGLRPSQVLHPHEFGHGETKPTCLFLRGLPRVIPTCRVSGRAHRLARLSPGPDRARLRSRFYPGMAAAMATQWTPVVVKHLLESPLLDTLSVQELIDRSNFCSTGGLPLAAMLSRLSGTAAATSPAGVPLPPVPSAAAAPLLGLQMPFSLAAAIAAAATGQPATPVATGGGLNLAAMVAGISRSAEPAVASDQVASPSPSQLRRSQHAAQLDAEITAAIDRAPHLRYFRTGRDSIRRWQGAVGVPTSRTPPIGSRDTQLTLARAGAKLVLPPPPPPSRLQRRYGSWRLWSSGGNASETLSSESTSSQAERPRSQWLKLGQEAQQTIDRLVGANQPLPRATRLEPPPDVSSSAIVLRGLRQAAPGLAPPSLIDLESAVMAAKLADAAPYHPWRAQTAPTDPRATEHYANCVTPLSHSEARLAMRSSAAAVLAYYAPFHGSLNGSLVASTERMFDESEETSKSCAAALTSFDEALQLSQDRCESCGQTRDDGFPRCPRGLGCHDACGKTRKEKQRGAHGPSFSVADLRSKYASDFAPASEPNVIGRPVTAAAVPMTTDTTQPVDRLAAAAAADLALRQKWQVPPPAASVLSDSQSRDGGQAGWKTSAVLKPFRPADAAKEMLRAGLTDVVQDVVGEAARHHEPDVIQRALKAGRPPPDPIEHSNVSLMVDSETIYHEYEPPLVTHTTAPAQPAISRPTSPFEAAARTSVVAAATSFTFSESDIAEPTYNSAHRSNSLFFPDFRVANAKGGHFKAGASIAAALADTGTGRSLVAEAVLAQLPQSAVVSRQTHAPRACNTNANGGSIFSTGTATIVFSLGGYAFRHQFTVIVGGDLLLLGNDFNHAYGVKFNFFKSAVGMELDHRGRRVSIPLTESHPLPKVASAVEPGAPPPARSAEPLVPPPPGARLKPNETLQVHANVLFSREPIVVAPRSMTTVFLEAPDRLLTYDGPIAISPAPASIRHSTPLVTAHAITRVDADGKLGVAITNLEYTALSLPALAPVALAECDHVVVFKDHSNGQPPTALGSLSAEQREVLDQIHIDEGNELTPTQLAKVKEVLAKRIRAFSLDGKTPGFTHLLEVSLDLLEDAKPFRHAPSRLGDKGSEIADAEVLSMERHGIIRKSNSSWASRVVLVSKKSGEPRFCVDLRDLNSRLKVADSPLPRCDDAIDQLGKATAALGGSTWFHTLDLTAGFWALPVKESHKERLAFVTQRGKWEFNRLPFGLASGPSYMQRLMEATLQGLAWEICLPYLDDVAIWASGPDPDSAFDQALERLDMVLERFEWAGLTAKAKKSHVFSPSVEYLGHVCSREGVSLDPAKIKVVKEIKPEHLRNLEDVRSFLGLVGYYRDHINRFHLISNPLVDLTKKGVDVAKGMQTEECRQAVKELVEAMCTDPVLAYPKSDRAFYVKTDAATGKGVGGLLVQKYTDKQGKVTERPVAYYGRRLNSAERNYTVTEIELLAVVECIKHWRAYLWGRHFVLVTDHAALKWLHSMRDATEGGTTSRLARWIMRLQEYDFEVVHKPGAQHADADGISRLAASALLPELASKMSSTERLAALKELGAASRSAGVMVDWDSYYHDLAAAAQAVHSPPPTEIELQMNRLNAAEFHLASPASDLTSVREAMGEDREASAYITFLSTDVLPPDPAESIATRMHSRNLTIRNGLLYRSRMVDGEAIDRLYIPESLRQAWLTAFHDRSGHGGIHRTFGLLNSQVWWPRMYDDVAEHVNSCHECAFVKRPPKQKGQGHVPSIGDSPFDTVVVDVLSMGEHPTTRGNLKILIFVDTLTRWVEAVALPAEPTSIEVLNHFINLIVTRYGLPRRVRSDRGKNLASNLIHAFYEHFDIALDLSTAEHHQSAGVVERFNDTITTMIKTTLHEKPKNWDDHLDFLLYSYRATPHRTTTHSPAYLLYGRELRLPTPSSLHEPVEAGRLTKAQVAAAHRVAGGLKHAWQVASQTYRQAQLVSRDEADRSHDTSLRLVPNERVLLRKTGLLPKLECEWEGPYRVRSVLDHDNYELTDLNDRRRHPVIHVSRLRPYLTVTDSERLSPDEFIVDYLLDRRVVSLPDGATQTQYKVKWKGYPKAEASWQARHDLVYRAAMRSMVESFDATMDAETSPAPSPPELSPAPSPPEPPPAPPPAPLLPPPPAPAGGSSASPVSPGGTSGEDFPLQAKFNRNHWYYLFNIPGSTTLRGPRQRWYPETSFTVSELESFSSLRSPAAVSFGMSSNTSSLAALATFRGRVRRRPRKQPRACYRREPPPPQLRSIVAVATPVSTLFLRDCDQYAAKA